MSFLLLLLTLGAATVAAILYQKLQAIQEEKRIEQQKAKESIDQLQAFKQKYGDVISKAQAAQKLDSQIVITRDRLKEIQQQANLKEQEINHKIGTLTKKLEELEEKDFIEEFGFYESKYDFGSASEYKEKLDEIRSHQKICLKNKEAAICNTEWTVSGSKKQGQKMVDGFLRLVLRAFNGECDAAIGKVKYNNVQTMENRISKAYETLNKLSETTHCEITEHYLRLKLDELYLVHEYQEKKQQEQEEQRLIREQMREEEKAAKEIEKARIEAEREEKRYQEALEKARREAENASGAAQEKLILQIQELRKRVEEAEANRQRAISQAQLTKSGYVYIISNIGSFGENIYKIGMTRRLNPEDRISELSNASVPFPFDIHAMISCSNAPELESRLHRFFDDRRINSVNSRKEFYRVSLDEIIEAVQKIDQESSVCTSEIRITKVAEASEYRKSLAKLRSLANSTNP